MALISTSKQMCVYILSYYKNRVNKKNLKISMRIVNIMSTHRPPVLIHILGVYTTTVLGFINFSSSI